MDPIDFFKTAAYLKDHKDEPHIRTSISRSYYAVHLHIRHFISHTFLAGKKIRNDPHKTVLKCLQQCQAEDIKNIGVMLSDLLTARTDADYEMSKNISPNHCQDIYDQANELLIEFEKKIAMPTNRQKFSQSCIQQARFTGILT
jgi:uncharacterized protein (UPF0332 family)